MKKKCACVCVCVFRVMRMQCLKRRECARPLTITLTMLISRLIDQFSVVVARCVLFFVFFSFSFCSHNILNSRVSFFFVPTQSFLSPAATALKMVTMNDESKLIGKHNNVSIEAYSVKSIVVKKVKCDAH